MWRHNKNSAAFLLIIHIYLYSQFTSWFTTTLPRCIHCCDTTYRTVYSSPFRFFIRTILQSKTRRLKRMAVTIQTEIHKRNKIHKRAVEHNIFQVVSGLFYCNRIIENQRVVFPSVNSGTFIYPVAFSWSTPVVYLK